MDAEPRDDLFKLDSFSSDGHPCRWLADVPQVRAVSWTSGQQITSPVPELRFTLAPIRNAVDHGPTMPDFFKATIPLVSLAVVETLRAAGATNFQTFPATIHDPVSASDLDTHVAINIIGAVPNLDWRIDSSAVGELAMFRIQPFEEWIVTEQLRAKLAAIRTLRFRSLRECAGRD